MSSGDEQPDYPAELLPTIAPVAPRPQEPAAAEEQPSLALTGTDETPAAAEAAEGAAPKRGRGRPRGSTNRRTPRAGAAGDAGDGQVSAASTDGGE
jgi:hypothetical protein